MASSRKAATGTVLTSSLVVLVIWGYRKLIEPAGAAGTTSADAGLRKVIGLEPTPANAAQFTIAFGFTYFTLSIAAMGAPELASAMAILIATGDVLANGASVFTDVSKQVSGATATGNATTLPTGTVASGAKGTAPVHGAPVRVTGTGQLH